MTRSDRDVPLGDIGLLEPGYQPGFDVADEPLDTSPLIDDEPFSQGRLDLDGVATDTIHTREPGPLRAPGGDELIIVMHVMRADRAAMPSGQVQAALGTAQLELGDMAIYHHYGLTQGGAHQPVFSVARAVEPGTFDPDDESSYVTPGLTLFMRLPGPQDGAVVLELMFNTAQTLARDLDAQVLDDQRNPLSAQALNHVRDRVAEFSRRQKIGTL